MYSALFVLWGVLYSGDAGAAQSAPAAVRTVDLRWSLLAAPWKSKPMAIGLPGAGCLLGAVRFPERGLDWVLVRPERRRNYGHPELAKYLRDLAARARARKLGKLHVGDLGQPCGGPTPTGHRSHQNGLDVDLWYAPPARPLRPGLVPSPPLVADLESRQTTRTWSRKTALLVELAASDPAVDRIFVHPAVKRALCKDGPRGPWLQRVRPWYGHHDHLHVRLRCPADSPECTASRPLPPGDGCDASLDWWWSEDARLTAEKRAGEKPADSAPAMPARCEALLAGAMADRPVAGAATGVAPADATAAGVGATTRVAPTRPRHEPQVGIVPARAGRDDRREAGGAIAP